jgi:uncharacterized surface protein with fasciclin (FAS1) repeats
LKELQAVLLYHVCPGRLGLQDYLDGTAATLDAGKNVTIDVGPGFPFTIRVNDIGPETGLSTLDATNGYATKLEGVLIPPTISLALGTPVAGEYVTTSVQRFAEGNLVDVIAKDPELTTLVTALKAANLVDALKGQGPFTVWAPNNNAFARLPKGTLEHLLDPANLKELQAVLLYHVCPGRLGLQDYLDGTAATLDAGKNVTIDLDASGFPFTIRVNDIGPETGLSTLDATNGYATKLDGVLIPPTISLALGTPVAGEYVTTSVQRLAEGNLVDVQPSSSAS